ncbi:hypothetical protein [Paenibacillus sp. FSL R7-0331]|uniref:hypothetical protein n=1 Tax=Paenibacillus sp. FSL R7-0331 TaxID=1536773 RepID=UPI0004F735A0|nr:hypothetical protein [Paenibacillus sp. FSL R7-0331]AIQ54583.1 hypothetical protein R70331_25800 [Paenibacillus sp. FSL R7-0331]
MNVHLAKKGHKVCFANRGGWDGEWERAAAVLKEKSIYTISKVDIYQSSTEVYLEGFGDQGFNSVFFELIGVPDYWKIEELTNAAFARFVRGWVEQMETRDNVEQFFITEDNTDLDDFDIDEEFEPVDETTVVVDVKFTHALMTFYFSRDLGKWDYSVLSGASVKRYEAISKGERPELPGVYSYESDEDFAKRFLQ